MRREPFSRRAQKQTNLGGFPAHNEWSLYIAPSRNPADRGFVEREGNIPLPSDGELDDDADAFDVLLAQIRFGGIVPGFPEGIRRRWTPRPIMLAQSLDRVDFARRRELHLPTVGIALLTRELTDVGARQDVLEERPDLDFGDLLAWRSDNAFTRYVPFRSEYGMEESIGILPVFKCGDSPFSKFAIFVGLQHQALRVQHALEAGYFSWAWNDAIVPPRGGPATKSIILWPSSDPNVVNSIPGLDGFSECPALPSQSPWMDECATILSTALTVVRKAIPRLIRPGDGWDAETGPFELVVAEQDSPMLKFLARCGLVSSFSDYFGTTHWLKPRLLRSITNNWTVDVGKTVAQVLGETLGMQISVQFHGAVSNG